MATPPITESPRDSTIFIPPLPVRDEDPQEIQAARQRLAPRSKLARIFFKGKKKARKELRSTSSEPALNGADSELAVSVDAGRTEPASLYEAPITLDASSLLDEFDDLSKDRYEWAVVYENQRGLTMFSSPYYSSLSLLPTDPSPYTLPSQAYTPSSHLRARSHQPPITLATYPLPDGTWHWVSRCWMIDMRAPDLGTGFTASTNTGTSGHDPDGFEYNWVFRRTKWRAEPGSGGAGAWVRRRRWVRLMVREARDGKECIGESRSVSAGASRSMLGTPALTPKLVEIPKTPKSSGAGSSSRFHPGEAPIIQSPRHRHSVTSSILTGVSGITGDSGSGSGSSAGSRSTPSLVVSPDEIFQGDDTDADWERCRGLMKRFGRDGKKLECWRRWLGVHDTYVDLDVVREGVEANEDVEDPKGKRRQKQWTEDEGPMPSEVKAEKVRAKAKAAMSKSREVINFPQIQDDEEGHNEDKRPSSQVSMVKREYLLPVLRKYTHPILHLFMFPESRADFIKLLSVAGVLRDLELQPPPGGFGPDADLGMGVRLDRSGVKLEVDFWSYRKGFLAESEGGKGGSDDADEKRKVDESGRGGGGGKKRVPRLSEQDKERLRKEVEHAILGPGALPRFKVDEKVVEGGAIIHEENTDEGEVKNHGDEGEHKKGKARFKLDDETSVD